jgi:diguanylate cyclase (GGDEF)-like protein
MLGCVGALSLVVSDGGALSVREIALFSLLTVIGQQLLTGYPNGIQVDCAGVFMVVAAVMLTPANAAASLAVVTVVALWTHPGAWRGCLGRVASIIGPGLVALGGMPLAHAAGLHQQRFAIPVAVVFALTAIVAYEFVVSFFTGTFAEGSLSAGIRTGWQETREYSLPITMIETPLAILIACTAYMWTPLVIIGAAPYAISWRLTRQAARLAAAELEAGTDPLTGLANRSRFFRRMDEELEHSQRYGHGFAVLMGDLDNFKRINDTLGHLVGDEVLRATATALTTAIDQCVFPIARFGGEEFVVAVPVLERKEVLHLAERARTCVEEALTEWNGSISIGVAYLHPADSAQSVIDRADKALYSAKYAGKNCVHEWRATASDGPAPVDVAA